MELIEPTLSMFPASFADHREHFYFKPVYPKRYIFISLSSYPLAIHPIRIQYHHL